MTNMTRLAGVFLLGVFLAHAMVVSEGRSAAESEGRSVSAASVEEMYDSPMQRLYTRLFTNYRKAVRPVFDDSHAVNLRVQFWLKQLLRVSEGDQILTIYCWLEMYWRDEYMTWPPHQFGNITTMHVPVDQIWQPDILVYNNANMNVAENELATNAIVSHDGNVSLFRAVITDVTCNLDLTKDTINHLHILQFPFDQQACYIMLSSWSFDGAKLNLAPRPFDGDNLQFYIRNNEWRMDDFRVRRNVKYYDCCEEPFYDIAYYFILTRNPAYYILTLIIPSAFITIVTIIGFFTPSSSTGENSEKVSLGVTALLSMAIIMMMVADAIPATGDSIPLIGVYYIGLIFILSLAAFATTVTLSIQMRGIEGDRPSPLLRAVFLRWLPKCPLIYMFLCDAPSVSESPLEKASHHYTVNGRMVQCEEHVVWRRPSRRGREGDDVLIDKIDRLLGTLTLITGQMETQSRRSSTVREWRQLTRVLERVLMLLFIMVVVLFSYATLVADGDPPLKLDDKLMHEMTGAKAM